MDPVEAAKNFRHLAEEGAEGAARLLRRGRLHAYVGIDGRRRENKKTVVTSYLAHHQGMTLVALANVLAEGSADTVKRFHADPRVKATELLLQERVPRQAPVIQPRPPEETRGGPPPLAARRRAATGRRTRRTRTRRSSRTAPTWRSSRTRGGGASLWKDRAVTQRTRRATRAASSSTCATSTRCIVWSAAWQPVGSEPDDYQVELLAEKVVIRRRDEEIETRLEIAVSPEDDAEVRRVALTTGATARGRSS